MYHQSAENFQNLFSGMDWCIWNWFYLNWIQQNPLSFQVNQTVYSSNLTSLEKNQYRTCPEFSFLKICHIDIYPVIDNIKRVRSEFQVFCIFKFCFGKTPQFHFWLHIFATISFVFRLTERSIVPAISNRRIKNINSYSFLFFVLNYDTKSDQLW